MGAASGAAEISGSVQTTGGGGFDSPRLCLVFRDAYTLFVALREGDICLAVSFTVHLGAGEELKCPFGVLPDATPVSIADAKFVPRVRPGLLRSPVVRAWFRFRSPTYPFDACHLVCRHAAVSVEQNLAQVKLCRHISTLGGL